MSFAVGGGELSPAWWANRKRSSPRGRHVESAIEVAPMGGIRLRRSVCPPDIRFAVLGMSRSRHCTPSTATDSRSVRIRFSTPGVVARAELGSGTPTEQVIREPSSSGLIDPKYPTSIRRKVYHVEIRR